MNSDNDCAIEKDIASGMLCVCLIECKVVPGELCILSGIKDVRSMLEHGEKAEQPIIPEPMIVIVLAIIYIQSYEFNIKPLNHENHIQPAPQSHLGSGRNEA